MKLTEPHFVMEVWVLPPGHVKWTLGKRALFDTDPNDRIDFDRSSVNWPVLIITRPAEAADLQRSESSQLPLS